jgi:hypothetical protein
MRPTKLKESNMQFLKHVGRQGDRKLAVLFRQVPGEDHMCLVIYPDVLPVAWHDAIMKVVESDVGQQAEELADALHRSYLPDGRVILDTLHTERMIKKVRTADVLMIPRPDSTIRLDELNKMLNEMKLGADAIKKMAQNDASRGMVDAPTKRAAEQAFRDSRQPAIQAPQDGALSDRDIAANMLAQAEKMEIEAKSMIAEASRMKKDAERMDPHVIAKEAPPADPVPPKRGRPAKAKVAADAAQ